MTEHLKSKQKRLAKRRKSRSVLQLLQRFATKHTWTIPLLAILFFISLYTINPTETNIIHYFIFPGYKVPQEINASQSTSSQYGKGLWDIAFVSFYTLVLSFTREFVMQELLRPLARFFDLKSRSQQSRFLEQMYTAVYFGIMGPFGIYVMSRTPVWYFNTTGMYESFPHKTHDVTVKFYYLFQAAYWAQQAIVLILGMEKRRKDFKELVAHHVVTLALIGLSYQFHFTYMGIAVYLTHDISDFFLATSKSLNYIGSSIQGPYFGFTIAIWIYLRHYINICILYSLLTEFRTVGPYLLDWETQQYKCLLSNIIAFVLLGILQALNLFWLCCLFRSAYLLVVYKVAKDERSEVEDSEVEDKNKNGDYSIENFDIRTETMPLSNCSATGTLQADSVRDNGGLGKFQRRKGKI